MKNQNHLSPISTFLHTLNSFAKMHMNKVVKGIIFGAVAAFIGTLGASLVTGNFADGSIMGAIAGAIFLVIGFLV